jgi:hypothetical protein
MRHAHQRLRLEVDERGPSTVDRVPQDVGETIRSEVRESEQHEDRRPPPQRCEEERGREPDEPLGADAGEVDEEPVEPADAVVDDPALEVPVRRD